MIVQLIVALCVVALTVFGWHPLEAAGANTTETQVQANAAASSGLSSSSYSISSDTGFSLSIDSTEGNIDENYIPERAPEGFIQV
jgi:hypothetical protein